MAIITKTKRKMPILGALIKRAMQLNKRVNTPKLSPAQNQARTLKRLMRRSAHTAFGQHYDFKGILRSENPIAAFRSRVPIHDYDSIYREWWHRTLDQEPNVCWPGKIKLFALSSGTTGAPSKHIPITGDMLRSIRRAGIRMFYNTTQFDFDTSFYERDMMMFGGSTSLKQGEGYEAGDLSGINTSKLPMWVRHFYKPGTEISSLNDWNERINRIAKEAPNWDIGIVAGIPSWIQLMLERVIEYNNLNHIHEIWPNFEVYVSGGVAFEPYKSGFEQLLGREIKYMDTYLASEGFIAIQNRLDAEGMAMLTDNGIYYEFIPFDETCFRDGQPLPGVRVLGIDEVEPGVDYALLLSSCGGAWRYMIGDTVRFTDVERAEIIITGRTKHFLSICGEHLSVGNMNEAIQAVEATYGLCVREYTVAGVPCGAGKFKHKWYLGCDPAFDPKTLQLALDAALRERNDDYSTERDSVLGMEVEVVSPHLFYQWYEQQGKMGGQHKIPRVMNATQFEAWETFVQSRLGRVIQ